MKNWNGYNLKDCLVGKSGFKNAVERKQAEFLGRCSFESAIRILDFQSGACEWVQQHRAFIV